MVAPARPVMRTRQSVSGSQVPTLIPRRVAASPGWLLLHLEFLEHLRPSLKLVLLSMPCRRLWRRFVTFSMDKKSIFNKLRIMHNALLMLWSSWFKFSLTEVRGRWRRGSWFRVQVGVSGATGPDFCWTMIR